MTCEITETVVQAALDAQWPGDECVYSEKHESAEAGMRAALTTAVALLREQERPEIERLRAALLDIQKDSARQRVLVICRDALNQEASSK